MRSFKIVKESKTLQEILGSRETFLQLGRKEYILLRRRNLSKESSSLIQKDLNILVSIKHDGIFDLAIPILPSYLYINGDFEVWNDDASFLFKMESDGTLSFQSGDYKNEDFMSYLAHRNISKIQIQNNIIWIWKDGKPLKKYYYAMQQRCINDATTYNKVVFLSEIQISS